MLQLFEALTRALAEIREEELVQGRWKRRVATSMGPLELTLECPEAVEAARTRPGAQGISPGLAIQRFQILLEAVEPELKPLPAGKVSLSCLEEALADPQGTLQRVGRPELDGRDLALLALSAEGPASRILARRALALHETLPNAHLALSLTAPDLEETLLHLGRAIETGEASLTEEARCFEGKLGDHPLGLPLLRAHHDRGCLLLGLGRLDEATAALGDLLALDRRDPLGARDRLTLIAIAGGNLDEARRWLGKPRHNEAPGYLFNRALLAFVEKGDTKITQRYLDQAIKTYPSAALALLDEPYELVEEPSSEAAEARLDESLQYAVVARLMWERVEGAMELLERRADAVLDEPR
jgi:tetratricopeptide (TPR) repeat protein